MCSSESYKRLKELENLNEKYKFIIEFGKMPQYLNEPNLHFYSFKINTILKQYEDWANSMQINNVHAVIMSYYEAIERFTISKYSEKDLIFCSYKDLFLEKKLNIRLLIRTKIPSKTKIDDTKLYWTKVHNFFENQSTFIPAQTVFLPFFKDDDFILRENNSIGAASGCSETHSIVNGISECLERDAFMRMFLTKTFPNRLLGYSSKFSNYIESFNLKINLFKLNNEMNFNIILCIVEDTTTHNPPALSLGCSCKFNLYEAIENSLLEALKSRIWIKSEILKEPNRYKNITKKLLLQ